MNCFRDHDSTLLISVIIQNIQIALRINKFIWKCVKTCCHRSEMPWEQSLHSMRVFFGPVFCCRRPPKMAVNGAATLSMLTIKDFSCVIMLNSEHGSESWAMRIAGKPLLMPKHISSAKSGRRASTCSRKELHLSSFFTSSTNLILSLWLTTFS